MTRPSLAARRLLVLLAFACAAAAPKSAKQLPAKPPLDFSGTWVLDEKASEGVSKNMHGAALRVEQSGDRIRILPLGQGEQLLGDQVVADGRPYEKAMGAHKGVLTAAWSKDGDSLWLEATTGPPDNPRAAVQRSIWKLSSDRKTWIRQTVTMQGGQRSESRLVFRKREKTASTKPSPRPSPGH